MTVELVEFIRPELKFDGLEALKKAIDADCVAAVAALKNIRKRLGKSINTFLQFQQPNF